MNILKFEVKNNMKTTLIWAIIVSLAGMLYVAMGPVFLEQTELMKDFMLSMGEEFLTTLGINFETFFSPTGYFAYVGGFIGMALAVQASIYGIKAFALEKNNKSLEFLYTKPGSRTKVFGAKLGARIILLSITQVIVIATLYFGTEIVNSVDYNHQLLFLMMFSYVPLQYMFLTLGMLIGVSVNRLKNIVPISLLLGIGMFFINMLGGLVDNQVFDYISFFNYYNLSDLSLNESYDSNFVILSITLITIFTISSLVIFNKKDMKVM